MTTKSYTKQIRQLRVKPIKLKKYLKHCAKKKTGIGLAQKKCNRCGRIGAHVGQYGLSLCRLCFRETATSLGFKKYS